jgi:prolyl oligopeptidase
MRKPAWTKGSRILAYNPVKKAAADTHLSSPGKYSNPPDLEYVEVKARSHDGVMVPLSIVYRKGTKLNGSHPLLRIPEMTPLAANSVRHFSTAPGREAEGPTWL